jgi:hypothetical protein
MITFRRGIDVHSFAVVAVRALGAYFVVANAGLIGMMLGTQLSLDNPRIAIPLAAPAASVVLGIVMMIWSKNLGAVLISGLETPTLNISAPQLLQVGTALLALFILATAMSDVVAAVWDYFRGQPSDREAIAEMQRQRAISYALKAVTSIGIGAVLLWVARGAFARERTA